MFPAVRMSFRPFFFAALIGANAFAFESVQLKKTIPIAAQVKTVSLAGMAVDSAGHIWVADASNNQLHLYSAEEEYVQSFGHEGAKPGEFSGPRGLAVSTDGLLYIADSGNGRVQIFTLDGKYQDSFGQKGSGPGQFREPTFVAVSRDGVVVVADKDSSSVQFFSKDGVFLHAMDVGAPLDGLTVDSAGHLYVSHRKLRQIEQWSSA